MNDDIHIQLSGSKESAYSKKTTQKRGFFMSYFEYYPTGIIKLMGQIYPDEFSKGIWYYFDEQGVMYQS